jgi:hypothetical protein
VTGCQKRRQNYLFLCGIIKSSPIKGDRKRVSRKPGERKTRCWKRLTNTELEEE